MTREEIILDWLSQKQNRINLPVMEVDECTFDALDAYGQTYHFDGDSVNVIGDQFKIIKKNEVRPTRREGSY
jgi:hypothetical protein